MASFEPTRRVNAGLEEGVCTSDCLQTACLRVFRVFRVLRVLRVLRGGIAVSRLNRGLRKVNSAFPIQLI